MEQETYMVCVADGGDHDYTITVNKKDAKYKYTLSYSNSSEWTEKCRGEEIMSITDDGNSYVLSKRIGPTIGPDMLIELMLLTGFIKKHDPNLASEYEILQKQTILKI